METVSNASPASTDVLCESCVPGKFQDGTGETECKACPAFSSSQEDSTKLEQCLAGAGYTGSGVSIVPCPAGTFKANVQGECTNCAAGQYSGAEAATECTSCSAGKFLPSEGGKSADDCKACDFGKYSTTIGANSPEVCVACGSDLIPNQLRSGCLACPNFRIPGRGLQTTLSPKGVLDLNYVKKNTVWWNTTRDEHNVTIFQCLDEDVCEFTPKPDPNKPSLLGAQSSRDILGYSRTCLLGREGPLCALCQPGRVKIGGECQVCGTDSDSDYDHEAHTRGLGLYHRCKALMSRCI